MFVKTFNGLLVLLVCGLLGACEKTDRFADGWGQGGNLHDVSLREWAFATDANRLASAADFVREFLPALPAVSLPLASALVEKCLTESSYIAAIEEIRVRSRIEPCIDYAQRTAQALSLEYAKRQDVSSQ
ncbi:hypothetical protein GXB78_22030 [Pseudomonas moraviensis subsp. stanleyae]|uniref:hypothetical protein n=1 Tax=Pseudomonas moraviensis TaxID=321662 RepID=UPI002E348F76|nr:hypothetical protein [Pseudomonas moraviensis]MED7669892.1 hypothetical protein [Pseudomonas moraviensis subsp. stanleyae]